MSFTRKDFEDSTVVKLEARRPGIEMMAQAAPKAEALTGNEIWDWYLSFIQAAIETTEGHVRQFEEKISDPSLSDEEVRAVRMNLILCRERVSAWENIITLPKELMEVGLKARAILEKMPVIA